MLYGTELTATSLKPQQIKRNCNVDHVFVHLCLALLRSCPVDVLYLDPRPSVVFGGSPGIDQALLVEA